MNQKTNVLFALSLAFAGVVSSNAQDAAPAPFTPKGSATIKVYSDLYYNATKGALNTQGFDLTRAYLGYQEQLSEQLSGDVKLDVGRVNPITDTGTGAKDTRYDAFLKTAGLKWQNILPMTTLQAGLIGTNLFDPIESFWQNRFVFPTFMDQNGFGSSADLGAKVAVKTSDMLTLNAELLNGEGYKAPQDGNGDFKASFSGNLKLPMGLQAVAYADEMPVHGKKMQNTYSGFLAYEMKDMFRIGGEYDYQTANKGISTNDWSGFSANAAYIIQKGLYVFARFDDLMSKSDWDKGTKAKPGKDGTTIIAGVDFDPAKNVKVAADLQMFQPAASGADAQTFIMLNLQYAY